MEALSDRILRENADIFDAMIHHKFVRDIEADCLPSDVFDRYLVIEGAFVDTAIAIFAHAVAKAPGIEERRWLIRVLDSLANEQVTYFEKVLAARDVTARAENLDDPRVGAFQDGMLRIAEKGGFEEIIAAMFAAEWMYWTWCRSIDNASISDIHVQEWVKLHAEPAFAAQACWLRDRLDQSGAHLSEARRAQLVEVFGRVQRLEIAFHDAAYGQL